MRTNEQARHQITAGESRCFQSLSHSWIRAKALRDKANIAEGSVYVYLKRFVAHGICEVANSQPPHYRLSAPSTDEGKAYLAALNQSADIFTLEGVES